MNPEIDANPSVCSCCQRNPPLAPAPFCAVCLLTQGHPDKQRGATGAYHQHLPAGTTVGPFEITELLGEGGFAEVYSALPRRADLSAEKPGCVALKIIKRGMDSRDILARFRSEQRTVQALSHPSIVPLLEAGFTDDGLPYFVMAQVDGLPVTDYCKVALLALRERLRLFLPLCDAVQHAHQKGIIHRDLKPSNILVEETPQGPVPKVIDFGIAKALVPAGSGETHVTQLGLVLGTPAYMSPEQAAGNDDADTRSDIYSLGAVLYEMLTGWPPFETEQLQRLPPGEWARHLRETPPPLASQRLKAANGSPEQIKQLGGDLDQIIRKAMSPAPDSRYASAAAFAEDVAHWLEDRPVSARPPSLQTMLKQFVRRHRWPVAVGISLLGGIIATAGIGTVLAVKARRAEVRAMAERNRALAAESRADDARQRSDHLNYQASVALAAIHVERGEPYLAAERLHGTPIDLRGWEWGYLMAAIEQPEAVADSGLKHPDILAATPDGGVAAVVEGNLLRVVDVPKNEVAARRSFAGKILRVALSDDGKRWAVVESRPPAASLHAGRVDGTESWTTPVPDSTDVAWEPAHSGGALLLVSGNGATPTPGRLARLDAATGHVLNERTIDRWKVQNLLPVIGSAGRLAAVENSYKDLEIVALPGLQTVAHTPPVEDGVTVSSALLDDNRDLLVVGRGPEITAGPASHPPTEPSSTLARVPTTGAGAAVTSPPPDSAQVRRLNWLPDGRWLATGEGRLLIQGEEAKVAATSGAVAELSLTGGRILSLLPAGRLEIRPELPRAAAAAATHGFFSEGYAEGRGVAFPPDSRTVFFQPWSRSRLETVPLDGAGSPGTPGPALRLPRLPETEWCVLPAACPDGTALIRVSEGLAATRLRPDGSFEQTAIPHTEGAWSADASADGALLAVGVPTGVRLLDRKTGAIRREWTLPGGPFRVALRRVGRPAALAVVAVSRESTLHHLPFAGPPAALPMPFQVNGYYPAPLAFHVGSPLLAGALEGGGYAVYDLRSLPSAPLLRQSVPRLPVVTALAFSATAKRLAVGTVDHRLTLWDWPQALPLLTFPLNSYCASVAFSPDGEWLANTDYNPSLVLRRALSRSPKEK